MRYVRAGPPYQDADIEVPRSVAAERGEELLHSKGYDMYSTDIRLGERYRDEQTGIEGVATAVSFYQYGCERVSLEVVIAGKIEDYGFDAPRLTHIESGQTAAVKKVGGPERGVSHVRPGVVAR